MLSVKLLNTCRKPTFKSGLVYFLPAKVCGLYGHYRKDGQKIFLNTFFVLLTHITSYCGSIFVSSKALLLFYQKNDKNLNAIPFYLH